MKTNYKPVNQKLISSIGVALIIILLIIKIVPFSYNSGIDYYDGEYFRNETKLDSLNDEIRVEKIKFDSLKRAKTKYIDGNLSYSGFIGFIGVGTLTNENNRNEKESYVTFANIGLKLNEEVSKSHLSFHTVNKQGYLTKIKFIKTVDGTNISYVDKKVDYNYDCNENYILAPLKSKIIEVAIYLIMLTIGVMGLALFLFSLVNFFKFLINISRNQAFSFINIKYLRNISISLFILSFSPFLINGIVYAIFISIYSNEGIELIYSFWEKDVFLLILAILSYVIYTAFKQAMLLQQEQDLTI